MGKSVLPVVGSLPQVVPQVALVQVPVRAVPLQAVLVVLVVPQVLNLVAH